MGSTRWSIFQSNRLIEEHFLQSELFWELLIAVRIGAIRNTSILCFLFLRASHSSYFRECNFHSISIITRGQVTQFGFETHLSQSLNLIRSERKIIIKSWNTSFLQNQHNNKIMNRIEFQRFHTEVSISKFHSAAGVIDERNMTSWFLNFVFCAILCFFVEFSELGEYCLSTT